MSGIEFNHSAASSEAPAEQSENPFARRFRELQAGSRQRMDKVALLARKASAADIDVDDERYRGASLSNAIFRTNSLFSGKVAEENLLEQGSDILREYSVVKKHALAAGNGKANPLYFQAVLDERPLRERFETALIKEAVKATTEVVDNYVDFTSDVISDGTLLGELRENYVRFVVTSNPEKAKEGVDTERFIHDYPSSSDTLAENYFHDAHKILKPLRALRNGKDADLLQTMFAEIVGEDISHLKKVVASELCASDKKNLLDTSIDGAVSKTTRKNRDESKFFHKIKNEVNYKPRLPDMDMWQCLLNSPLAREIMGDELDRKDEQYYQLLLEEIMEGSWIACDGAVYYPTPETIHHLVLMMSVDDVSNRAGRAKLGLKTIAQREDWQQRLDAAVDVYPELATFRAATVNKPPTIEDDEWPALGEEIQQINRDFTIRVLADAEANDHSSMRHYALKALPTVDVMAYLGIDPADRQLVLDAGAFLLEHDEFDHSFKKIIRHYVTSAAHHLTHTPGDEQPFVSWAQLILSNREDRAMLTYLTSKNVRNQFQSIRNEISLKKIPLEFAYHAPLVARAIGSLNLDYLQRDLFERQEKQSEYHEELQFFNSLIERFGEATGTDLIAFYLSSPAIHFDSDARDSFIEEANAVMNAHTRLSVDILSRYRQVKDSPFAAQLQAIFPDEADRDRYLLDYGCFLDRRDENKIQFIESQLSSGIAGSEFARVAAALRWLPDAEIDPRGSTEDIHSKYRASIETFKKDLNTLFADPTDADGRKVVKKLQHLEPLLETICEEFGLPSREVLINDTMIQLPTAFITQFGDARRNGEEDSFVASLAGYLMEEVAQNSTAYTVNDLLFWQVAHTEDSFSARKSLEPEEFLLVLEDHFEAATLVWQTAIAFQQETPDKPLFLIANERTGPSDVAAEFLPSEFAERHGVKQDIDYDTFFQWFGDHLEDIDDLYTRSLAGEDVTAQIPSEALSLLESGEKNIVPIYRLKVPSSLKNAKEVPEGIDKVVTFFKLASLLGGKTLVMDESRRAAPKSIECVYNVLRREEGFLGDVDIKLFGKLDRAMGQNGTKLVDVSHAAAGIQIGFVDPWKEEEFSKAITDDSKGFVPAIKGAGIVEIVDDGYYAISPYGVTSLQEFWKRIIANEVCNRFLSEQAINQIPERGDLYFSQAELKNKAFDQPYKAVVLDLDGTCGSRGEYDGEILEKIKELAESGTEVIIGTARSLVDHPKYSGSVQSFITQLGELTEQQQSRLHLATENGGVLTSMSDLDTHHINHSLPRWAFAKIDLMVEAIDPDISCYPETTAVILRDFPQSDKERIMRFLQRSVKNDVPVAIGSESGGAISVRAEQASKRNALDWLGSRGISINEIAKIGDSPDGNDGPMFVGRGAFNVGRSRKGTLWTIHMNEVGGGPEETNALLDRLSFEPSRAQ